MNEETLEALESLKGMEGMEGIDTSMGVDVLSPQLMNTLGMVDIVLNVFMLLAFLGMGYGIYVLAKKMGIKHAWMGWIPVFQYYTMCKIADVKFFKHVIVPFLVFLAIIIVGAIMGGFMFGNGGMDNLMGFGIMMGILYVGAYIFYIVRYVGILSPISKRTGRGGWTTAGLFFIPFIMFPVVGYKYLKGENKVDEKIGEVEEETKVEL